jgi:hypothetical protein
MPVPFPTAQVEHLELRVKTKYREEYPGKNTKPPA